jgi:TfoX/Sxy family transcriptional regulator of competence genes
MSQAAFEAGCKRFVYLAKAKPMSMNYHTAPEELLIAPPVGWPGHDWHWKPR